MASCQDSAAVYCRNMADLEQLRYTKRKPGSHPADVQLSGHNRSTSVVVLLT